MPRRNVRLGGDVRNTGNVAADFDVQLAVNNPQEPVQLWRDYTQRVKLGVLDPGQSKMAIVLDTKGRAPNGGWALESGDRLGITVYLLGLVAGRWEGIDVIKFPDYVEP